MKRRGLPALLAVFRPAPPTPPAALNPLADLTPTPAPRAAPVRDCPDCGGSGRDGGDCLTCDGTGVPRVRVPRPARLLDWEEVTPWPDR